MVSNTNKQIIDTIKQMSGSDETSKCILELYNWELVEKGFQFKEKYRQTLMEFSRRSEKNEN